MGARAAPPYGSTNPPRCQAKKVPLRRKKKGPLRTTLATLLSLLTRCFSPQNPPKISFALRGVDCGRRGRVHFTLVFIQSQLFLFFTLRSIFVLGTSIGVWEFFLFFVFFKKRKKKARKIERKKKKRKILKERKEGRKEKNPFQG